MRAEPYSSSVDEGLGVSVRSVRWSCSVDSDLLAETVVDPAWSLVGEHDHAEAKVFVVVRGGFWEAGSGTVIQVGPGDLFVRPAGARHGDQFGGVGLKALRLTIPGERLAKIVDVHSMTPYRSHRPDLIPLATQTSAAIEQQQTATARDLTTRLLGAMCERFGPPSAPTWLGHVRGRLFEEADNSVSTLARDAGVHPTHLSRAFHRHYGITLKRYARRCRIFRAATWISTTDRPLAEIAARCGYCDQSHLSRAFTAERGTTPAAYRRRARPQRLTPNS